MLGTDNTTSADGADGRYIVVMRPGPRVSSSRATAIADARRNGAAVRFEYAAALQGFAARLPRRGLDVLRRNHNVAFIEADHPVELTETELPATEGLDRVDQRTLPLSGSYDYVATGSGVTAYIIDTGIRFSHNEFGGRAVSGFDAVDGGSADDCNGHGTHVSGTVGGRTYGIAKAVSVIADGITVSVAAGK